MRLAASPSTRLVTSTPRRPGNDARAQRTTLRTGPRGGMRPRRVPPPEVCSPTGTGREAVVGIRGTRSSTALGGPDRCSVQPLAARGACAAGGSSPGAAGPTPGPRPRPRPRPRRPSRPRVPGGGSPLPPVRSPARGGCGTVQAAPDTRGPGATRGPPAAAGAAARVSRLDAARQEQAGPRRLPTGAAPRSGERRTPPGKRTAPRTSKLGTG